MDKFIKILRVILVLFFIVWIISWASIRAFKISESKEVGLLNKALIELSETPSKIRRWFQKNTIKPFLAYDIDSIESVLKIGEASDLNKVGDSIYLLHYTFVNNSRSNILLQNIKTGEIEKKWVIPLDIIMRDLDSVRVSIDKAFEDGKIGPKDLSIEIPKSIDEILIRNPLMLQDGSILIKGHYLGFIYKINHNSKVIWRSKRLAHHSIEIDEKLNIWTCSIDLNNDKANNNGYRDDAVLCLDNNGNEVYFKSLTNIFVENNVFDKIIESTPMGSYAGIKDPYHLNDVQPVRNDGFFWEKGDVFLSIRNKSLVTLFRPSTSKLVWIKQGPWLKQHDVNIESDSLITIFNNNTSFISEKVKNSSNVAVFSFITNSTDFILNNIFSSETQGRQVQLKSKDFFIEETNTGLYYLLDSIGSLKYKFYIPYPPKPDFAHFPGWARIYIKENGKFIEQ